MKKLSFADVRAMLDEACLVLRSFTLAWPGFNEQHGEDAIHRVNAQCDRLKALFGTGPHAKTAAFVMQSARTRILAAEARLALLQKDR